MARAALRQIAMELLYKYGGTGGWGSTTCDGTGLQHGKPGEEGVEGEVEKDKKLQGLEGGGYRRSCQE